MNNNTAKLVINEHLAFNTGPMRLFTIWNSLKLEIKIPGMRMSARVPKCSTILRKEFGMSGKPEKLLAEFQALLVTCGVLDADRHDLTPHAP